MQKQNSRYGKRLALVAFMDTEVLVDIEPVCITHWVLHSVQTLVDVMQEIGEKNLNQTFKANKQSNIKPHQRDASTQLSVDPKHEDVYKYQTDESTCERRNCSKGIDALEKGGFEVITTKVAQIN